MAPNMGKILNIGKFKIFWKFKVFLFLDINVTSYDIAT